MSQKQLAGHLGISFQQVQKYERGINRISAGRLLQIATCFGIPIEFFFDGLPSEATNEPLFRGQERVLKFAMTREGSKLNRAYLDSASPHQRKIALEVLRLPVAGRQRTVPGSNIEKAS